jgi:mannose-6-phosphate isomerase-like protein (cupin superfamily)
MSGIACHEKYLRVGKLQDIEGRYLGTAWAQLASVRQASSTHREHPGLYHWIIVSGQVRVTVRLAVIERVAVLLLALPRHSFFA